MQLFLLSFGSRQQPKIHLSGQQGNNKSKLRKFPDKKSYKSDNNKKMTNHNNNDNHQRYIYKLHPTTIVLRSQQLNLLESQQQAIDESINDEQQNTSNNIIQQSTTTTTTTTSTPLNEQQKTVQKKDRFSLIPQFTVPAQLCMPKSGDSTIMIGNRTMLLGTDPPTILPRSSQLIVPSSQSNTSSSSIIQLLNNGGVNGGGGEIQAEIEQHIHQQQQQQQSAFTGPFLLYRNADWTRINRLKQLYSFLVFIDVLLLVYTYLCLPWIRALLNFQVEMPIFGFILSPPTTTSTLYYSIDSRIGQIVALVLSLLVHGVGLYGFWRRKVRFLTLFLSIAVIWILVNSVVVVVSAHMGTASLFHTLRLVWFSAIVYLAMRARDRMQVNWYMTNQF